ncbi:hypothetical protein CQA49_00330 [Helicobacter sp. MIT 00-7814]|uniref:hypothetical protein n=1 Tax=unclassified Helicobacter TaxID=2593540 RepID=UPI000E1F3E80|nr:MULTISPECIES: hypothetical protein [unclassified Helicobacter]RDU57147.1 hypothetical protein CQA49_00330 [Helicobacter sp. MIT 00-7814]RDU57699.1 hypothetical protein CQA37_00330 [Helicobacter sp. MIT 99-10781]
MKKIFRLIYLASFFCLPQGFGAECYENADFYFKVETNCNEELCNTTLMLLDKKKPNSFLLLDSQVGEKNTTFTGENATYILEQKALYMLDSQNITESSTQENAQGAQKIQETKDSQPQDLADFKSLAQSAPNAENPISKAKKLDSIACVYADGLSFNAFWQDLGKGQYQFIKQKTQNNSDGTDKEGDFFSIYQNGDKLTFESLELRIDSSGAESQSRITQDFLLKPLSKNQAYITSLQNKACGVLVEKKEDENGAQILKVGSFANKSVCDFLRKPNGEYLITETYTKKAQN